MAKNWAICIGVNEYHNLPSLNFAVKDAEKMRDWFVQEAGFESSHVYLFTDNSPPIADAGKPYPSQPTYATLIRFLDNRFEHKFLSAGDNLWFFFSGHGLRHGDRDYLMLSDSSASGQLIERTAIALSYVTERLRRCGADNVVIVQDACRNDSKGLGVGEEKQAGVITFASCSPAERSYEIEALQHGAFTYALLESLRLQGEGNCATVERLYQRLRYRVAEINQLHKKPRQTPYAIVEPATKYHLILLPKQATLHDINVLKMDAQEAELERDLTLAEQLWTRILAVSPADNQALKALRRIWQQPQGNPVLPTSPPPISPATAKGQEVDQEKRQLLPQLDQSPTSSAAANLQEFEIEKEQIQSTFENLGNDLNLVVNLGYGVTLEMILIPAGNFMMGSPKSEQGSYDNERPQHRVSVPAFLMGKYPVTQAQWRVVTTFPQVKKALEPYPSYFKGDDLPVEQISGLDAVEFCARLSEHTKREYRLPSEAEWEYACRAGTTTAYFFGNEVFKLGFYAWYTTTYRSETTYPVGRKKPNGFGLYDMHGNVWEWCDDDWHENYDGAPTDGRAWINDNNNRSQRGNVLRGGSWDSKAKNCRSSVRGDFRVRGSQYGNAGFRVVCDLQLPEPLPTSLAAKGQKVEPEKEKAKVISKNLGKEVSLEIVAIPAGSFMMGLPENEKGRDNERPQHLVSVPAFLMGKYPVTQDQWRAVAGLPQVEQALKPDPSHFKGDDRPVEQVSWLEAVEFCARLSNHSKRKYRLPSEAEWEYACRAGSTTSYFFGNDAAELENYTWYRKNSGDETHSVGQKLSNAFGLYDMHGNVWEWCEDD